MKLEELIHGWKCIREKPLIDYMMNPNVKENDIEKIFNKFNTFTRFEKDTCGENLMVSLRKINNKKFTKGELKFVLYYNSVTDKVCAKTGKEYNCQKCKYFKNNKCHKKYRILSKEDALKRLKKWFRNKTKDLWAFYYKKTNNPSEPTDIIINE